MTKYFLFLFLALISILGADSKMGCSISELLVSPKNSLIQERKKDNCKENTKLEITKIMNEIAITETLMSIKVLHEKEEIVIKREVLNTKFSCPPFCIEPMNIKGVVTVAELEVLTFINKLKEKKARLLIDVRESSFYVDGTIPGAINLPFSMLKDESKYQEKILKLLGGKLKRKSSKVKWSFRNVQCLLIFGNSATSSNASMAIKKLLELGYPSSKLLYYRTGISSWKRLGLTIY